MFWSATKIEKNHNGKWIAACGSFNNINIDGRLSESTAMEVAKKHLGDCFAIERTSRFVNYKNPRIIGLQAKPQDILFLL